MERHKQQPYDSKTIALDLADNLFPMIAKNSFLHSNKFSTSSAQNNGKEGETKNYQMTNAKEQTPTSRNPQSAKNQQQIQFGQQSKGMYMNRTFLRQNTHSMYETNYLVDGLGKNSPYAYQRDQQVHSRLGSRQQDSRKKLTLSEQPPQHFHHIQTKISQTTQANQGKVKIKFGGQYKDQLRKSQQEYGQTVNHQEQGLTTNAYATLMNQNPRLKEHLLENPLFSYLIKTQGSNSKVNKKADKKYQGNHRTNIKVIKVNNSTESQASMNSLISKRNLKELASHYFNREQKQEYMNVQDQRSKLSMHGRDDMSVSPVIKKQDLSAQQKEIYNTFYQEFAKNFSENITRSVTRCKGGLELQGKALANQRALVGTPTLQIQEPQTVVAPPQPHIQKLKPKPSPFKSRPLQQQTLSQLIDLPKTEMSMVRVDQQLQINEILRLINAYLLVTVKYKDSINPSQIKDLKRVSKQLGIKLTNGELQNTYLKSKDFVSMSRTKLALVLNRTLIPQQLSIHRDQTNKRAPTFKFWVELSGNNHNLVKSMMKRRNWLTYYPEYDPNEQLSMTHNSSFEEMKVAVAPTVIWTQMRRVKIMNELTLSQIYNHVDGINNIASKTGLFNSLRAHYEKIGKDVFDIVPETYIIDVGSTRQGSLLTRLADQYKNHKQYWIVKPGEGTNRGHGIQMANSIDKVQQLLTTEYNSYKTVIVQKYIMNPYLIHKRKFDIRVFCLLTYYGETKTLRAYFYNEGYLRTSCKEFSLSKVDNKYIHLTNDAIQKYSQDYGKFESGNKLSYEDFQKLLLKDQSVSFYDTLLPQIRNCCRNVIESAQHKLVGEIKKDYNAWELLGLDFMIDEQMKLYLIEVNTNPCLETQSCMLLSRIIPQVLDQTMKIAIDPFLKPTEQQYMMNQDLSLSEFKYELMLEHQVV